MESYKFRKYAFHKTYFFGKFFGSFWTIFRKFENTQKILENGFGLINENNFSKIVSKFSVSVNPI